MMSYVFPLILLTNFFHKESNEHIFILKHFFGGEGLIGNGHMCFREAFETLRNKKVDRKIRSS